MERRIWVKVYKTDTSFFPDGQKMPINCKHFSEGRFGMNTEGQFTPLPGSDFVLEENVSPPTYTSVAVPAGFVGQGQVFENAAQPNLTLTEVILIKDMVTLTNYFVDAADYAANIASCNPS